jgi:hypothetical protein
MSSFQFCFNSWDKISEDQYCTTFSTACLSAADYLSIYGPPPYNNGTTLSFWELNARVVTTEYEDVGTRTRRVTLYPGELRSLLSLFRWMRAGYPLAISYYVVLCYDDEDCISTSVVDIELEPTYNSFLYSDMQTKIAKYDASLTIKPCDERSVTLVLRELL